MIKYTQAVLDYVSATGIAALIIERRESRVRLKTTMRLQDTSRLAADSVVKWVPTRADAEAIIQTAKLKGLLYASFADVIEAVEYAARKHAVHLVSHGIVIARARAASAKFSAALSAAAQDGRLHRFHQEYKSRRLAAEAQGESFMPFTVARQRFARELVYALTNRTEPPDFERVFNCDAAAVAL